MRSPSPGDGRTVSRFPGCNAHEQTCFPNASARAQKLSQMLNLDRLREIREELIGQFLGRAADQTLTKLRELAADLRFDVIRKQRAAVLLGKSHGCTALGEARDSALT